MKKSLFISFIAGIVLLCCGSLSGQPAERFVKVNIAPENPDWVYKTGEKVKFNVLVTRNDVPLPGVEINYEFGPEMLPPTKKGTQTLKDGRGVIDAGSMSVPGFMRCRVTVRYNEKEYEGLATAAFDPENILPTATLPDDFTEFWDKAKTDLKKVPIDARMTLLPERCTGKVNVYHVNLQNYKADVRLYGILCVPKAPGRYPAIFRTPGATVRGYAGDIANAERGAITFEIGIHGIPVNMDSQVYSNLINGALHGYWNVNLDDKDRYYYKRVYMGCVRSIDFIYSLPEFDGTNLIVAGGSQGGALAIVTSVLDERVKGLVAFYPALCDLAGYLNGRAGGWPHMFKDPVHDTPQKIETSGYYDVVNFARQLNIPGFYSWGYNDVTCPPTSIFAAYNSIIAPKTLLVAEETGHWTYPEQWEQAWDWVFQQFE